MRSILISIAIFASLAGCAGHELAKCGGPILALNPGQWQPGPADTKAPPEGCQP